MKTPAYGVLLSMRSRPAHRRELVQSLDELRERTAGQHPSARIEITEDLLDPVRIVWTEWWPAPEDRRVALESDRFRALLGAVRTLGRMESLDEIERAPMRSLGDPEA